MRRMRNKLRSRSSLNLESLETRNLLAADVVINELMYHPASNDSSEEFIEFWNRGDELVDLTDWRISNGVAFSFPATTLEPDSYLVVAADVDAFRLRYGKEIRVVGGWDGRLANRGEEIELRNAQDEVVDQIRYADEGEWSKRILGATDRGFRGWTWDSPDDGDGRSLELVNAALPNEFGQNWKPSNSDLGTPG